MSLFTFKIELFFIFVFSAAPRLNKKEVNGQKFDFPDGGNDNQDKIEMDDNQDKNG